jgi:hypothetical protein
MLSRPYLELDASKRIHWSSCGCIDGEQFPHLTLESMTKLRNASISIESL